MEKDIEKYRKRLSEYQQGLFKTYRHEFDSTKQVDKNGDEFWSARDLRKVLDYGSWRKFHKIIEEAKIACGSFSEQAEDHFVLVDQMIKTGKGAKRKVVDYHLTFYACGLIVQAADGRKEIVAAAQAYYIIQTAKMEAIEKNQDKHIDKRAQLKISNLKFNNALHNAGYEKPTHYINGNSQVIKTLYNTTSKQAMMKKRGITNSRDWYSETTHAEQSINDFAKVMAAGAVNKHCEIEGAAGYCKKTQEVIKNTTQKVRNIALENNIKVEELPLKKQAQLTSKTKLT